MRYQTLTHPNFNNNHETTINFPISESEFKTQFSEVFQEQHYKEGIVKNGVYVDIGANIGLTTLFFNQYASPTAYYAIEPSKECFEALKSNTTGLNVKLFNTAILPYVGEEKLYKTAEDSVGQTFFAPKTTPFEMVNCMPIDIFFEENSIEHVDVLKVDIESSEYALFPDDSFKRVADRIDLIIGESHYDTTSGAIPDIIPIILKEYGFTTTFTKDPNCIYQFNYRDPNGKTKDYSLQRNTMFVARRHS